MLVGRSRSGLSIGPPPVHKLDLHQVEGVDVGVAGLDRPLEPGRGREQFAAPHDVENRLSGAVALRRDPLPDLPAGVFVDGEFCVALGDVHVGLGQREGRIVDRGLEERPLAIHVADGLPRPPILVLNLGERRAQAVPRRNHAAALRPRKHPGDRAEIVERPLTVAAGGPRRDRQVLDVVDRRGLREVADEARLVDEVAVDCPRALGHPRGDGGPLGLRLRPPHARRHHRGPRHLLQMPAGDLSVVVPLGEHLALLGEPQ